MADLFYLYQKYQKIGDQPLLPQYPPTYSIDGEGTKVSEIKYGDYCKCGDINQVLVFWQTVPNEYICTDCGEDEVMERWITVDPGAVNDYICEECPVAKLYATYSDTSTYLVDCNASASLTRNEVRGNTDAAYSAMTSVQIGSCVNIINTNAFRDCSSLSRVYMPTTITTIGSNAFWGCTTLSSFTVSDSVTSLGTDVFQGCSGLKNVYLSSSLTIIQDSTFQDCYNLEFVTVPSGVTQINNFAFDGCSKLTLTMESTTPPTLDLGLVTDYNHFRAVRTIRVPGSAVAAYNNATGWSQYRDIITGY